MRETVVRIDSDRLRALLEGINDFGANRETGGHNRMGFSDADMAARRWFARVMRDDGLAVHTDAAGNVFGRFGAPGGPCVMAGSHLDTVPEGGAFDGALGVCVALECARAIRDAGLETTVPLEVAAFAEEEGRFGGMLGSQAVTGQVTQEWLENAVDAEGVRLADAMRAQGFDPAAVPGAARAPGSVRAFLELHVEQGPVLEAAGVPIGIARAVSGVCNLSVRLDGRANHSGTTPMELRADAFAGLAEIGAAIPGLIAAQGGPQSRITIGKVTLRPNFPHTIPGRADFSVILRDTDEAVMRALNAALRARIAQTATGHGLTCEISVVSWLSPTALDRGVADLLQAEAARLGLPALEMPSGAGHDAQTMQALCPSALVFVPSRGGVSHAPEEWTDWPAIEAGAALMLAALVRLTEARPAGVR
jgi:hydantoinase/carbamoylase family amidase